MNTVPITPRTDAFENTCGDYEKPHRYIKRLTGFARDLEIECASLKSRADSVEVLVKALRSASPMLLFGAQTFCASNFTDRGNDGPRFAAAYEIVATALASVIPEKKEQTNSFHVAGSTEQEPPIAERGND